MDVTNQPGQSQKSQQTENFGEPHDPQRPCCLVDLRVNAFLHNEKDIIHRDGRYKVHYEPRLEILFLDLLRVQYYLGVFFVDNARAKVQHQVHEEECIGHNVEENPGGGCLLFEEGDAHGNDDQVAYHKH